MFVWLYVRWLINKPFEFIAYGVAKFWRVTSTTYMLKKWYMYAQRYLVFSFLICSGKKKQSVSF